MNYNPDVDAWFVQNQPAAEPVMRRVRDVILGADSRIGEYVKYWTVVFGYNGDLASLVQWKKKKPVSLMFNRGAHIPGNFPHLEGTGPTARFMRFDTVDDVKARAAELKRIVVAWCDL